MNFVTEMVSINYVPLCIHQHLHFFRTSFHFVLIQLNDGSRNHNEYQSISQFSFNSCFYQCTMKHGGKACMFYTGRSFAFGDTILPYLKSWHMTSALDCIVYWTCVSIGNCKHRHRVETYVLAVLWLSSIWREGRVIVILFDMQYKTLT